MSRIYFMSKENNGELLGAERAHIGLLVKEFTLVALGLNGIWLGEDAAKDLLPFIPDGSYMKSEQVAGDGVAHMMGIWFASSESCIIVDGESHDTWHIALNTASAMGEPIRLLTRLHAQCEIHCYVEEENREWMADIIDTGRKSGIYRPDMGWEEVAALLRNGDGGPVVTSYSVCDTFPHRDAANWEGSEDEWWELTQDERWEAGLVGIRSNEQYTGLEIKPDEKIVYGTGLTGFQLRSLAVERQHKERGDIDASMA